MAKDRPDLKPLIGQHLTVVAWVWARTVKSPNPAFADVDVPLVSSFLLTPMAGKEAWVEPIIEDGGYRFKVRAGKPKDIGSVRNGTKIARGAFRCVMSGSPFQYSYIDEQANAGRMGTRLMAIVAEGDRGRVFLSPTPEHEAIASKATPVWRPDTPSRGTWASNAQGRRYGFRTFGDYFTARQLVSLTTFSDLVGEAIVRIKGDAIATGLPDDNMPLGDSGTGATAYSEAVAVYLSFLVSKLADKGSTICTWDAGPSSNRTASGRSARVATVRVTFSRQAIPMTWDFAEVNFFSDSVGSADTILKTMSAPLAYLPCYATDGASNQADARNQRLSFGKIVSTDPPYYDNVGYADFQISSTSGSVARCAGCFRIYLPRSRCPRPRSWWPRHIATVAKKRQRDFSLLA